MKVSVVSKQSNLTKKNAPQITLKQKNFSSQAGADIHSYKKSYKTYSLLETARRDKHMRTVKPKIDEDAPLFTDGYENFGDFSNLNIDLVRRHGIPPVSGDSYRNPLAKSLIQFANGEIDKNGAIHVAASSKPSSASFLVGKNLDAQKFAELKEDVFEEHFMNSSQIFVTDASVGSQPAEYYVRVISDNANTALFLRKTMIPAPTATNPAAFNFDLNVYVTSKLSADAVGERLGVKGNSSIAVYNPATKTAYLAGEFSSQEVLQVISSAVAMESLSEAERVVLPLACDVVGKKNFDIVFPSSSSSLQGADLVSSMNAFWQSGSLTRFWNSAYAPATNITKGSFVEHLFGPEKSSRTVQKLTSPYTVVSPSNVVFLVEDKSYSLPPLSKLSVESSLLFFASGYKGASFDSFYGSHLYQNSDPNQISNLFKTLLEVNKVNSFLINTTPKGQPLKPAEIKALLATVNDGSAAKAVTGSGKLLSQIKPPVSGMTFDQVQPKEQELLAAMKPKVANISALKSLLS